MMAHAAAGSSFAGTIHAGDILVVDSSGQALVDVNPMTGNSFIIASGFLSPKGVAIDANGNIYVSDIGTSSGDATISRVNPTTGQVTVFSGNGVGSGPGLDRPFQIAFASSGQLYAADAQAAVANTEVIRFDANGNRIVVSGNGVGSGDPFGSLRGLTFDKNGNVIVSAPFTPGLFRVDGSGARTELSTAGVINTPEGLAMDKSGRIVTIDGNLSTPAIYYVDPATGQATVLSDNIGHGSGQAFGILRGVTLDASGNILATDILNNEIFEINPTTGDRFVVSGNGVGGTTFAGLDIGIAVYPQLAPAVPEPSSLVLAGIPAFLAFCAWARGRSSSLA
jgi:DNA-binding beta-propeller fold protein YncE